MSKQSGAMGLVALDRNGTVWLDGQDEVLLVDGVRVTMAALVSIVNPDPSKYFRAVREADIVTVTQYTRGAMMTELGVPGAEGWQAYDRLLKDFAAQGAELRAVRDRAELDKLAHDIAYADSCVAIESNTFSVVEDAWYDIANGVDESAREYVDMAVRYLEMRGLIERDPARPGCINIRDESEATA